MNDAPSELLIQGGAKTFTPMMHRNDFATMFGLLSDRFKVLLRANLQVFIDAIIAGVVADIDADDEEHLLCEARDARREQRVKIFGVRDHGATRDRAGGAAAELERGGDARGDRRADPADLRELAGRCAR